MERQNYTVVIKALLATILAVIVGVGVHYAHRVTYLQDPAARNIELMQTYMQEAQALFIEKSIQVQDLAVLIWDKPGYRAVRLNSVDSPLAKTIEGDAVAQAVLDEAFAHGETGASVKNIVVTKEATYFYTSYTDAGIVGFVYENSPDSVADYDTMELLENWKIFYRLNE